MTVGKLQTSTSKVFFYFVVDVDDVAVIPHKCDVSVFLLTWLVYSFPSRLKVLFAESYGAPTKTQDDLKKM